MTCMRLADLKGDRYTRPMPAKSALQITFCRFARLASVLAALLFLAFVIPDRAQTPADANAPVVTKVEPPNWWVGLTPDVMVLLSGKNLQATHAQCNLSEVV